MRLLNVRTMKLKEFHGDRIPPYDILSHRWSEEEVSYKDFTRGRATTGSGYQKIRQSCEFVEQRNARVEPLYESDVMNDLAPAYRAKMALSKAVGEQLSNEVEWVWIDTCAELSEAINSMYTWYADSNECVVYLADMDPLPATASVDDHFMKLRESSWFSRGWTLQELVAPRTGTFCNSSWDIVGHICNARANYRKCKHGAAHGVSLLSTVSEIAGIPKNVFGNRQRLREFAVAQKMAWAADRVTTRVEDQAYCLLGLFEVNMPLLYGEGSRAFHRLQHEIIQSSTDQSVFAWHESFDFNRQNFGFFADSPRDFAGSSGITIAPSDRGYSERPYTLKNMGLEMNIGMTKVTYRQYVFNYDRERFWIRLGCGKSYLSYMNYSQRDENDPERFRALPVYMVLEKHGNVYRRAGVSFGAPALWQGIEPVTEDFDSQLIYIRTSF